MFGNTYSFGSMAVEAVRVRGMGALAYAQRICVEDRKNEESVPNILWNQKIALPLQSKREIRHVSSLL